MPIISSFFGIIIRMHLTHKEHNPPHIHALYAGIEASFYISSGEVFEGDFPNNGKRLVKEFILQHSNELLEMWNTEKYHEIEGFDK